MCNRKTFRHLAFARQATTVVVLLVLTVVVGIAPVAQAQSFKVIHNFTGQGDGATPESGLTVDAAGKIYGTTSGGGSGSNGSVFKLASGGSGWVLDPLNRGLPLNGPESQVVIGPSGNLFGASYTGGRGDCLGSGGCGLVYELQLPSRPCSSFLCSWTQIVLYQFGNVPDGGVPQSSVVFDSAGNLYGTTEFGGTGNCYDGVYGCGTVYELTPSDGGWMETVIYSFQGGSDGEVPRGGVIFDAAGNLYGTTAGGGSSGEGTIFELSLSGSGWNETILHNFQGSDGSAPWGNLIADLSGNLYGVASEGGANNGGAVFELSQPGSWAYNLLYSFPSSYSIAQGTLVFDGPGNLYGTTGAGGDSGAGTVYKLTPSNGGWTGIDLHEFQGFDGKYPSGGLVFDSAGNLYGTAQEGGEGSDLCGLGCGTVWEITP